MKVEKVPLRKLQVGMIVFEKVVSKDGLNIAGPGTPLTLDLLLALKQNGINEVAVKVKDRDESVKEAQWKVEKEKVQQEQDKVKEASKGSVIEDGKERPKIESVKAKEAYSKNVSKTSKVFESVKGGEALNVAQMQDSAVDIVENALDNPQAFASLNNMKLKDEYIFKHSVETAALATLLGYESGIDGDDLKELTLAALLHDVGMMLVADSVLQKPGKLTDSERQQVEKHPFLGYQILKRENVDEKLSNWIMDHHERLDSKGYPMKKKARNIHTNSKIISICDVFSALTNDRPYRKAFPSFKAIKVIAAEAGTHFDQDLAQTFQKMIGVYPNGTLVNLSSGAKAKVIDQNKSMPMRPVLQLTHGADGSPTQEHHVIDLLEQKSVFIKGIAS